MVQIGKVSNKRKDAGERTGDAKAVQGAFGEIIVSDAQFVAGADLLVSSEASRIGTSGAFGGTKSKPEGKKASATSKDGAARINGVGQQAGEQRCRPNHQFTLPETSHPSTPIWIGGLLKDG